MVDEESVTLLLPHLLLILIPIPKLILVLTRMLILPPSPSSSSYAYELANETSISHPQVHRYMPKAFHKEPGGHGSASALPLREGRLVFWRLSFDPTATGGAGTVATLT